MKPPAGRIPSFEPGHPGEVHKQTLLAETGLDIVCGPLSELCACYHNGYQLGLIQLEVADLDFVSCWLEEEDSVEVSEVRNVACAGSNLLERGSRAWARS